MSGAKRRLAVAVVSFGSADLVARNLGPLVRDLRPHAVILVDSFSTAGERDRARRLAEVAGWTLVAPDRNTGFGGGANLAARAAFEAGATDLLLVNPDASLTADDVARLGDCAAADRTALVSPRIVTPDGGAWFAGLDLYLDDGASRGWRRRDEFHHGSRRSVAWLSGACLWVTHEVWDLVGGIDEDYFLYWEDVDLSYRLQAVGGAVVLCDAAVAVHDEGGTHRGDRQRPEALSETYYRYNIRNRLLFAAKHLAPADVVRWRRTAFANARRVLLRGGRRQFLHPVAPLRGAVRGLLEGLDVSRAAAHPDSPDKILWRLLP